ncbi:AMP-binding protein [Gemmatimonas sp.]|uniref:AMP-binding protein n=1 Tax=Gemmatimonas sp. TaxID=1962908 RepID=UPI0035671596
MDIGQWVRRSALDSPERVAVRSSAGSRTYAEVMEHSSRLANALAGLGLERGDRVLVLLENRLEYPEIDLGIVTGGFVRVALNARLGVRDFSLVAEDSGARVIISEEVFDEVAGEITDAYGLTWIRLGSVVVAGGPLEYDAVLASARSVLPDVLPGSGDTAWISYTSGTTGRPKGVVLSHRAITEVARNLLIGLGPVRRGDGILLPQPVSHGAGYFVLPYLAGGGTVRLMRHFDPHEAADISVREHIGALKCVPDMLNTMVSERVAAPFSSIIYGAAPIAQPQLEAALNLFGPVLTQIYGQSEAPATLTILDKADHARVGAHRNSAGRPWPFVATRIVDPDGQEVAAGATGELIICAPHQMDGYFGREDLTREVLRDGWIWTRDMAFRDDEGYIHLQGRRDDIINSGGFNIAPREVENVLVMHPSVEEVAVIGLPDARWGQAVTAFVVVKGGVSLLDGEIEEFSKPLLGFRCPRHVIFVEALPRNSYGKVDLVALRQSSFDALLHP